MIPPEAQIGERLEDMPAGWNPSGYIVLDNSSSEEVEEPAPHYLPLNFMEDETYRKMVRDELRRDREDN